MSNRELWRGDVVKHKHKGLLMVVADNYPSGKTVRCEWFGDWHCSWEFARDLLEFVRRPGEVDDFFKRGETVRPRSGGPLMTVLVNNCRGCCDTVYRCQYWHNGAERVYEFQHDFLEYVPVLPLLDLHLGDIVKHKGRWRTVSHVHDLRPGLTHNTRQYLCEWFHTTPQWENFERRTLEFIFSPEKHPVHFSSGDRVKLQSGGELMTIEKKIVGDSGEVFYKCSHEGRELSKAYQHEVLRLFTN